MKTFEKIVAILQKKIEEIKIKADMHGFKDLKLYCGQDNRIHFLVTRKMDKPYIENSLDNEIKFKVLLEHIFQCHVAIDIKDDLAKEFIETYEQNSISIDECVGYSFVLLSVHDTTTHNEMIVSASKLSQGIKAVIINQEPHVFFYGLAADETWQLTKVDNKKFNSIHFPTIGNSLILDRTEITEEILQEITAKKLLPYPIVDFFKERLGKDELNFLALDEYPGEGNDIFENRRADALKRATQKFVQTLPDKEYNNPQFSYDIALKYRYGWGCVANANESIKYLKNASDKGHAFACFELFREYMEKANYVEALKYAKIGASAPDQVLYRDQAEGKRECISAVSVAQMMLRNANPEHTEEPHSTFTPQI